MKKIELTDLQLERELIDSINFDYSIAKYVMKYKDLSAICKRCNLTENQCKTLPMQAVNLLRNLNEQIAPIFYFNN